MTEFYTHFATSRGKILLRGINNGRQFKETIDYKPYHYVPARDNSSDVTSIDGKPLSRIDFESINDAKQFLLKYEDVDNFKVYGFRRHQYTFIHDRYKDMKFDAEQVSVVYFDIEVVSDEGFPYPEFASKMVTAVSFRKGPLSIVLGMGEYKQHRDDITYIKCNNERDLLFKFIDVWNKLSPDIISGWNIEQFDIPYMVNRIKNVLGENSAKALSPWNQIRDYTIRTKYGKEVDSYEILGITTIDMMEAYRKFSFQEQESYRLDHIAFVELGQRKVDYKSLGYKDLMDLYRRNHQLYIEYNMLDSDLVLKITEKTGLIKQIMTLAYDAGVNYADAFTSVLLWEVIIANYLNDIKQAPPTISKRNHKGNSIVGAFVKDPQVGKHKWVVGLDLDSLYPHLIMQYNISPETLMLRRPDLKHQTTITDILQGRLKDNFDIVTTMRDNNWGYTPNGCFFSNEKRGFLPALMDSMYNDRKRYKKLMIAAKQAKEKLSAEGVKDSDQRIKALEAEILQFHNLQMAKKICLNSAYGALSNEWFSFFDIDLAEAITYPGQLAIKWIARDLNEYLNKTLNTNNLDYVLASDTDSAYLTLERLVKQIYKNGVSENDAVPFLIKVCDKINEVVKRSYDNLKTLTNAYEQKMSMKVESISAFGLWKAKKRYALKMLWDEGVVLNEPKIKIKGIEAVQSSTPSICRDVIKKCIGLILDDKKTELFAYVDEFEKKFKSSPFLDVAYTSSINETDKYYDAHTIYTKGAQAHIRGALIYNFLLQKHKMDGQYERIKNGEKVKVVYLTTPNPINDNVISCPGDIPKEFGLDKFIDYDKQFTTEFLKPVNAIAQVVGWDLENRATLESFFG